MILGGRIVEALCILSNFSHLKYVVIFNLHNKQTTAQVTTIQVPCHSNISQWFQAKDKTKLTN